MKKSRKKFQTGFAERLKLLRGEAGFSQQRLADLAELHVLTVAQLEQSIREPNWTTVLALADALGVTPNDFRSTVAKPARSGTKGSEVEEKTPAAKRQGGGRPGKAPTRRRP